MFICRSYKALFRRRINSPNLLHANNTFVTNGSISLSTNHYSSNRSITSPTYKIKKQTGSSASSERLNEDNAKNDGSITAPDNKMQNLLTNLGLSISKWRIYDNEHRHKKFTADSATQRRRIRSRRPLSKERRLSSNPNDEDVSNYEDRLLVHSVHAARTVNLVAVLTKVFGGRGVALTQNQTPLRHVLMRTSIIIQLPPTTAGGKGNSKYPNPRAKPKFVAIFQFGSIVFFNVAAKEANSLLKQIKKHGADPISQGFERKENFEVAIRPCLKETARVNGDIVMVKDLNMNSVAVISTIMAKTVVLDSYNDTVDELLATFASINSTVKRTGNFTDMERESLFKVVAQNNSLFIDMIAELGIKDRSDTAWNLSQYAQVHEGMKDEFEIDSRFEHIEFKLNLIQQNAKFFLEILQSQKADTAEWIIIVLIAFECVLMLLDMSGMGNTLLGTPPEVLQIEQNSAK